MSHITRHNVGKLESLTGPGLWVSEEGQSQAPEPVERARYVFERTASGLVQVAVRGYNGGEPMDVSSDRDHNATVHVNGRPYIAVEADRPMHEVPLDDADAYLDAMYEDDVRPNLLVGVLEQEAAGVFTVLPSSGPNNNRTGQLIIESHKRAAICWDYFDPSAEFVPMNIEHDGPLFHFVSARDGWLATYNSMVERTSYFPTEAVLERDILAPGIEEDIAFLNQVHTIKK